MKDMTDFKSCYKCKYRTIKKGILGDDYYACSVTTENGVDQCAYINCNNDCCNFDLDETIHDIPIEEE